MTWPERLGTRPFPTRRQERTTMRPQAKPIRRQSTLVLADRVCEVRRERYGDQGGPTLADALGLPHQTWMNYESGVTIPALVILRFIDITGVRPAWLLNGEPGKYDLLQDAM